VAVSCVQRPKVISYQGKRPWSWRRGGSEQPALLALGVGAIRSMVLRTVAGLILLWSAPALLASAFNLPGPLGRLLQAYQRPSPPHPSSTSGASSPQGPGATPKASAVITAPSSGYTRESQAHARRPGDYSFQPFPDWVMEPSGGDLEARRKMFGAYHQLSITYGWCLTDNDVQALMVG
jgi:hypothetical protein